MGTFKFQMGLAEMFSLFSVLVVAALLGAAFRSGWTIGLVPGITYVVGIAVAYTLYRLFAAETAQAAKEAGETAVAGAAFRVVGGRGVCPLGLEAGDVVSVDGSGTVVPQLCAAAEEVLRLAASGRANGASQWCCPVYDHLLVFERELKAA